MDTKPLVVVIENTPSDVTKALRVLKGFNIEKPVVLTSVGKALMYLEDVVSGARICPDLIILDLEFGPESGFEILRYRKTHSALQQCHVLVWTVMGDTQKELCRLFGLAHVVSKQDGEAALASALKNYVQSEDPAERTPSPGSPVDPNDASGRPTDDRARSGSA